jgi:kynurenine formamidase
MFNAGYLFGNCQIEKLANPERLPATGFSVVRLPIKVHKCSAGWARPVAIIESLSAN